MSLVRALPLLVAALTSMCWPAEARGPATRDGAQTAFRSVVLLLMADSQGQLVALGSGFVVAPGIVATNLHVIERASTGVARMVGQKASYVVEGTVSVDERHDLVLLKVRDLSAPALGLAKSDSVAVGDTVFAVGNPQGLEGTFSAGIVSGNRATEGDRLLQVTAPISPGSSGGPVLNVAGDVVGVAVATLASGQNLNFAIPVEYLRAAIGVISDPVELTPTSRTSSPGPGAGRELASGVDAGDFRWADSFGFGGFSLSIRNKLNTAVTSVRYLVIFRNSSGEPVHTVESRTFGEIRPGLASRETYGQNLESVRGLTARVEIRVLDFRVVTR